MQPRKFETASNCHLYLTFVNICKTWAERQELDGIPRNNILSCGIQPGSLGPRPEQARAPSVGCRWRWPPDVLFNTCRSFSKLLKNFPSNKWSKHPTRQNPMEIVLSSWIFFLIFYLCIQIQIQNLWDVPCKLWSHSSSIPFHAHDQDIWLWSDGGANKTSLDNPWNMLRWGGTFTFMTYISSNKLNNTPGWRRRCYSFMDDAAQPCPHLIFVTTFTTAGCVNVLSQV